MVTTTATATATATATTAKPRSEIVSPSRNNDNNQSHHQHRRQTGSSSTPDTAASHSRTRVISHGTGEASATKNYILGDCLGRGAFGSVYRALNWSTGETVAVKRVQLRNIPKSELGEIMREIELLKNLKHPNIVKYKGYEKTREYLFIVLEYCENGSLQNICKRFGKFPEGLVSIYTNQVLEGLQYLHHQGVIHRDIKGANILTTKDGSVKLADFGVATRTGAMSDRAVVGSPYWMAPEVIDQSGATAASDIWSVGCVVIELLQGQPPYHFLDPMPALFRIVQDDCPPLPDGVSPMVVDFLLLCFEKDATLRVSARHLLAHPWMASARRQLKQMKSSGSIGRQAHDRAVQSVQAWNEVQRDGGSGGVDKAGSSAPGDDAAPQRDGERTKTPPSLRRVAGNIANLYGDCAHRAQQQQQQQQQQQRGQQQMQARPPLRSIATANNANGANVHGLGPESPSEWSETALYFASGTARPQAPKRPPLPKHFTEHANAPRQTQSAFTSSPSQQQQQQQQQQQRPPYTQQHRWSASDAQDTSSPRRRTESCTGATQGGGSTLIAARRTASPEPAAGMARSRSQHQQQRQRQPRGQPMPMQTQTQQHAGVDARHSAGALVSGGVGAGAGLGIAGLVGAGDDDDDDDEQWAAVQPEHGHGHDFDGDTDVDEDDDGGAADSAADMPNMDTIRPRSQPNSRPASRGPLPAPSTPKKRALGLPRSSADDDEVFVDASDDTPKASRLPQAQPQPQPQFQAQPLRQVVSSRSSEIKHASVPASAALGPSPSSSTSAAMATPAPRSFSAGSVAVSQTHPQPPNVQRAVSALAASTSGSRSDVGYVAAQKRAAPSTSVVAPLRTASSGSHPSASAPVSPTEDYSDLLSADEEPKLLEKIRKLRRQQVQGGSGSGAAATLGRRLFLPADLKAFAASANTLSGSGSGSNPQRERRLSRPLRAVATHAQPINVAYGRGFSAHETDTHADADADERDYAAAADLGITVVAPFEPTLKGKDKDKDKDGGGKGHKERTTTSPRTSVLASGWETFKASAPRRSVGGGSASANANAHAHAHTNAGLAAKFARRSAILPGGVGVGVADAGATMTLSSASGGAGGGRPKNRPGHVRASSSVSISLSSYRASSPDLDDGAAAAGESYYDALEGQPPAHAHTAQGQAGGREAHRAGAGAGAPGKEALAKFLRGWDRRLF